MRVLLSFQGSRWTLQATTMDGNFVSKKEKAFQLFEENYQMHIYLSSYVVIFYMVYPFFLSVIIGSVYNSARSDAGETDLYYTVCFVCLYLCFNDQDNMG